MKFSLLQDFLSPADMQDMALGAEKSVELPTDAPIESIGICLSFTPTAVMATDNCDGISNLLQSVVLETYGPEGVTPLINVSGAGLLELQAQEGPAFDRETLDALGTDPTSALKIWYWLDMPAPELSDLISPAFLVPAHLMTQKPVLKLRLSTKPQMDTHATPTFAVAAGVDIDIVINRRYVNVSNFKYLRWDIQEVPILFPASGNEQRIYLTPPGYASGILLRGYTGVDTRGNPLANSLAMRLVNNGVQERRFKLDHIQAMNDRSRVTLEDTASRFPYSWFFDFLSDRAVGAEVFELGSLFDLNIPEQSGRKAYFVADITGGAGVQFKMVTRRLFDLPGR